MSQIILYAHIYEARLILGALKQSDFRAAETLSSNLARLGGGSGGWTLLQNFLFREVREESMFLNVITVVTRLAHHRPATRISRKLAIEKQKPEKQKNPKSRNPNWKSRIQKPG